MALTDCGHIAIEQDQLIKELICGYIIMFTIMIAMIIVNHFYELKCNFGYSCRKKFCPKVKDIDHEND